MRIKNINSAFVKNVTTLMTGTVLAQLCSIFAAPVLSRIFTPEDYGIFATYNSVCGLMGIVCSFKYEQGILIQKSDEDSQDVLYLALGICVFISLLNPLLIIFISNFSMAFDLIYSNGLIFFVTISIFCSGVCEILRVYFLRNKQFKIISARTVSFSLITVGLNIFCGFYLYSKRILVISTTVGWVVALILFLIVFTKLYKKSLKKVELRKLKNVAIINKQFPLLMIGQLINTFTGNLPILILGNYFSQSDIGQYSFVQRIVSIPMIVIGTSVNQVFLQNFSILDNKEQRMFFIKTSLMLFIGILPFAIVGCIFAPPLFNFVFGEQWLPAAYLARLMAVMYVFQFFSTPVMGVVCIVKNKLDIDFCLQILRLILVLLSFFLSIKKGFSFDFTILTFSLSMTLWYLIYFFWAYMVIKYQEDEDKQLDLLRLED